MKSSEWSDRRHPCLWAAEGDDAGFWVPERAEIVTQFFTRYLFFSLAVIYFSTLNSVPQVLFTIEQLLVVLGAYFFVNSWFFHLALREVTLLRIRSAMAADLVLVTLCVIHDPNPIPPSALAFLMVLLGNGMRYGMRLFAEVLGGAVLGMAVAFALRYRVAGFDVSSGDVFFGVFWVTLALYAYILMGRIEEQRRELDFRSRFDALTGLLNRHGLLAEADIIFARASAGTPATVLFADLNQFKMVNDHYGHGVGDRVLAEFAQIFSESAEGGVCGRWGGDEFVALLPEVDDAGVRQIFERVRSRTEAWSASNGLPMAVSLGVAHAPRDGHDLITLLSVADIHLYQSKSQPAETPAAFPIYRTLNDEPQAT
ncbi:GGDEF domain-containing protein [Thiobacillus sedimenti]|uniref:diguanylate cyclase n=1 Tax=Thiobacillus sedimenti TaxID=3110231 RepID=A0ABZ1CN05_9PROT|nr:GGDEF domain-containing protein [Thiobacillus sp. SCUT-2]WRS40373.1 GGDEF domain-containing protein [Thiobacillus sp. SCUT-2]